MYELLDYQSPKSIFKSKTAQWNALIFVVSVALLLLKHFGMDEGTTLLTALVHLVGIPVTDFPAEADYLIIAGANIFLRVITKEPVRVPGIQVKK